MCGRICARRNFERRCCCCSRRFWCDTWGYAQLIRDVSGVWGFHRFCAGVDRFRDGAVETKSSAGRGLGRKRIWDGGVSEFGDSGKRTGDGREHRSVLVYPRGLCATRIGGALDDFCFAGHEVESANFWLTVTLTTTAVVLGVLGGGLLATPRLMASLHGAGVSSDGKNSGRTAGAAILGVGVL